MNIPALISKYNGQTLDYDGVAADAGQCVQLVEYILTDKDGFGLAPFFGNAIDWWNNYGDALTAFNKVTYQPGGYPRAGDIVIWNASLPASEGFGHIDLCIADGNAGGFTGFDSNWGGKYAHEVQHNYSYVLGYLRLKEVNMDQVTITKEALADYDYWKAIGQQLSYTKAWTAIGGDWHQVMPVLADLETYGDFVKNSPAWQGNSDVTKLDVVAKGSTGSINHDSVLNYIQDHLS